MSQVSIFLSSCWWNYFNLDKEKVIQYLSPIAGSKPGWYLWLKKRQGVYELILNDVNSRKDVEISSFIVKYYPLPEEEVFERYATQEQIVRLSNYFDDSPIKQPRKERQNGCPCSHLHYTDDNKFQRVKGLPKLHHREKMNPSLFTIGLIKFYFQGKESRLLKVKLISQDTLVEYSNDGIILEKDGTLIEVVKPGSLDRSIPAWEICWDLYDLLIKDIFAQMGKFPKESKRKIKKGFIYYKDREGVIWSHVCNSVKQITHDHLF